MTEETVKRMILTSEARKQRIKKEINRLKNVKKELQVSNIH